MDSFNQTHSHLLWSLCFVGGCTIDYRFPKDFCSYCHLKKFRTILKTKGAAGITAPMDDFEVEKRREELKKEDQMKRPVSFNRAVQLPSRPPLPSILPSLLPSPPVKKEVSPASKKGKRHSPRETLKRIYTSDSDSDSVEKLPVSSRVAGRRGEQKMAMKDLVIKVSMIICIFFFFFRFFNSRMYIM